MPEVKASELVQRLINKWDKISMFISATGCPFVDEVEARTGVSCDMHPPCEECLATYELCCKHQKLERDASRAVFSVLGSLKGHKIIYERHEK